MRPLSPLWLGSSLPTPIGAIRVEVDGANPTAPGRRQRKAPGVRLRSVRASVPNRAGAPGPAGRFFGDFRTLTSSMCGNSSRSTDRRCFRPNFSMSKFSANSLAKATGSTLSRKARRRCGAHKFPAGPQPRRPRPQDPEDAIEDTPVVHAGNAARLVREHRFDDAAFAVTEFIAHDSMLSFGSLNMLGITGSMAKQHVRCWGTSGPTAGTATSTRLTRS